VRLQDLDFDRKQLKVYKEKEKKTAMSLSIHLIRGLQKYIKAEKPKNYLSTDSPKHGRR
jgi:hypothetical protein